MLQAIPRALKWSIVAVVLVMGLSPLYELFDRPDVWGRDPDLLLSVMCAFCLLGFTRIRRRILAFPWIRSFFGIAPILTKFSLSEWHEHERLLAEFPLFLAFRDLRI